MEKSKILELVTDGSCYFENIKLMPTKEYQKNFDELYKLCEKLCANMSEEEKRKTINDISMAQGCMEAITADEYFKEGFKLGLIIGAQNFLD